MGSGGSSSTKKSPLLYVFDGLNNIVFLVDTRALFSIISKEDAVKLQTISTARYNYNKKVKGNKNHLSVNNSNYESINNTNSHKKNNNNDSQSNNVNNINIIMKNINNSQYNNCANE